MIEAGLAGALAFVVAAVLTGLVRRFALSRQLLDVPNARSSHAHPTPRGGGLAIVVAVLGATVLSVISGAASPLRWAVLGAGGLVATAGWLDDRGHVPASARLVVHFLAAAWGVVWLGGLPSIPMLGAMTDLGLIGDALAVVCIVWLLNLYNFMDGIDGIAGVEAVTVAMGAIVVQVLSSSTADTLLPSVLVGAAAGFLLWNLPRARIFLGDVGSGFIGVVFGVLALGAAHSAPELLWAWFILLGAFVVDATVTLLRRLARGERVYEAHRSHAYQRMARRAASHAPVSFAYGAVNLVWLLPIAALAASGVVDGLTGLVIAYFPLVLLAWFLGAGQEEVPIAASRQNPQA